MCIYALFINIFILLLLLLLMKDRDGDIKMIYISDDITFTI